MISLPPAAFHQTVPYVQTGNSFLSRLSFSDNEIIEQIAEDAYCKETGGDALRVKYVAFQGAVEELLAQMLASGEIDCAVGFIHAPSPATPLCITPENPTINVADEQKQQTVLSRAQILRKYLQAGGHLHVVYPKGGLEARTAEQQTVYQNELAIHSGKLFDVVLSDQITPDKIGATYLFRDRFGEIFAFSIQSRQIQDVRDQADWGVWFGLLSEPIVAERVNAICDYLAKIGGPDLRVAINSP